MPRDLPVEGRTLKGVHSAIDFLTVSTQAVLKDFAGFHPHHREGQDVPVLGGGDTAPTAWAPPCARAANLTQLEILAVPPMDRAEDNPWPEWPKVYKMDYGQEEAAAKFGADLRLDRPP